VVGAGAVIADQHYAAIRAVPGLELVAVCDVDEAALVRAAERTGAPHYLDLTDMLREVEPDIVSVLTPHPFHASVAIAAVEAGSHVLVEKPLAVTVSEADRMIDAATRAGKTLAVSFQQRFAPMTERLRGWLRSQELGEVQRVSVHEPWLRTAAYFEASTWRATWRGEGGGVLMNQAPHALDLLTDLLGLPAHVIGLARSTRHATECEDSAFALLEWESGTIGYFGSSTTEPQTGRRVELVCDRAKVVVEGEVLRRWDYTPGLREHAAVDADPFGSPVVLAREPERLAAGASHADVYADLLAAVTEGRPVRCGGLQAREALEVANAIAYSSWTGSQVRLPLDRSAYDAELSRRQAQTATGRSHSDRRSRS